MGKNPFSSGQIYPAGIVGTFPNVVIGLIKDAFEP